MQCNGITSMLVKRVSNRLQNLQKGIPGWKPLRSFKTCYCSQWVQLHVFSRHLGKERRALWRGLVLAFSSKLCSLPGTRSHTPPGQADPSTAQQFAVCTACSFIFSSRSSKLPPCASEAAVLTLNVCTTWARKWPPCHSLVCLCESCETMASNML